jgi:hypothetical protein
MDTKVVSFKKKSEVFDIAFTTIPDDKLHPCALFYFMNDEVESIADPKSDFI